MDSRMEKHPFDKQVSAYEIIGYYTHNYHLDKNQIQPMYMQNTYFKYSW